MKRAVWFSKRSFIILLILILLSFSGCSDTSQIENQKQGQSMENKEKAQNDPTNHKDESDAMRKICGDLYEKAARENRFDDLEVIRTIVKRFGENGYAAVDSKNQIDMTEAEQVIQFCEKAAAKEEAELTIIQVAYYGGFIIFDFHTKDGKVDVVRTNYDYKNGKLENVFTGSYQAKDWKYTKDGYLMFSGTYYSEEMQVLTSSNANEHIAFRILPLDEKCRELNRQYLLHVSYERNNMFLLDWNEEDFGQLNFYDLFDIFYPKVYGEPVPYTPDDNLGVGAVYQISKEEFENVIMTYFNIDSDTLRSKTTYDPRKEIYEYKPRGFYEIEGPYPYPEVTGYRENSDGTITLMVHVVFPDRGVSSVYTHETVIRPLENGKVQYVSNRVISTEDPVEAGWHTPRLTEEKWKEIYELEKPHVSGEFEKYE